MSGKPFHKIDIFGKFVEMVYDVSQEIASCSKYAIGHICQKLFIQPGKAHKILFERLKIFLFIWSVVDKTLL